MNGPPLNASRLFMTLVLTNPRGNRMELQNLKIEFANPDELLPYVNNARLHSAAQIKQIAESIKEYGFTQPVLIRKGIILAGHGRVLAAKELGLAQIPTITLDRLSDVQARAYVIADNKIALNAGWDTELLKIEIGELESLDTPFKKMPLVKKSGVQIPQENDYGMKLKAVRHAG
jgi:hypothetical protein